MGKQTKREGNYLDYVPFRRVEWEVGEDQHASLLFPRFGNHAPGRWFQRLLGLKNLHLDLDERGSWIWSQCDGRQTVYQIGHHLQEKFPEDEEDLLQRVALFIQQLERSRAVEVKRDESHEKRDHPTD